MTCRAFRQGTNCPWHCVDRAYQLRRAAMWTKRAIAASRRGDIAERNECVAFAHQCRALARAYANMPHGWHAAHTASYDAATRTVTMLEM